MKTYNEILNGVVTDEDIELEEGSAKFGTKIISVANRIGKQNKNITRLIDLVVKESDTIVPKLKKENLKDEAEEFEGILMDLEDKATELRVLIDHSEKKLAKMGKQF